MLNSSCKYVPELPIPADRRVESSMFLQEYASAAGIEVFSPVSHTLFNPADIIQRVG